MIHETAVVHPTAEMADGVEIGPYAIIGERVKIGEGTRIGPHVIVDKWTVIGEGCQIYQYASLGTPPQHLRYNGEETYVIIGNNNIIREFVTINRGTPFGNGKTVLGDNNFIMAYAHIAHDCIIGSHVIMASYAGLAGHVEIGDYAVIGGMVAIHQFVRIGTYAFIGGGTSIGMDIPPYVTASGIRAKLYGINVLNLQRHNFSEETIKALRKAYKIIFRSHLTMGEALKKVEDDPVFSFSEVRQLVEFIKGSKRGVTKR
ncbi:MAG: acyl-[acyl-carrier-protein]--UDP-N-acetylglucosamine O-acyltransferase [Deltaproteobacteria bacterium]|nr:MAG: acyl-[acyl-carrier-protein]--UDP-N-acetylglucosamine O-acyltransferase [Deltaproteobacteria bacterium]